MKLGIISDTHGDRRALEKIAALSAGVGHYLHAGDNYQDAVFLAELTKTMVTAVAGNCDYQYGGMSAEECLEINGVKIFLTHGHQYKVKRTTSVLLSQGLVHGADIIVFGHTHVPFNEREDGVLIFNPGSASYPRDEDSAPTFGIITVLGKNNIQAEIIPID